MNETNIMTVTVKLSADDIQSICEIAKKIKQTNRENKDDVTLDLNEKDVVYTIFSKIAISAKRKADKLEAISSEFKTSIEYGNIG